MSEPRTFTGQATVEDAERRQQIENWTVWAPTQFAVAVHRWYVGEENVPFPEFPEMPGETSQ